MSESLTPSLLTKLISEAKNKVAALFNHLLSFKTTANNKKAALIAYWLKDYTKYITTEDSFHPKQLVSYRKGRIVQVNFGFRVGNELGGLHYAIVIDKKNSQQSGIITVVPLSSLKPDFQESKYAFQLKTGLFQLVSDKVKQEALRLKEAMDELDKERNEKLTQYQNNEITLDDYKKFEDYKNNKVKQWNIEIAIMMKHLNQMQNLKSDTVVNVSQITTVSKMRIHNPKTNKDLLFGIKVSDEDLLNLKEHLEKLYIF